MSDGDRRGTRWSAPERGPGCSCARWPSSTPTTPWLSPSPTSTAPGWRRTTAGSQDLGVPRRAPPTPPSDFTAMLAAERVDEVLVTTVDRTHADYIVAALHAGCDVVTEKPMTTDADGCRRILAAVERTGRRVRSPSTTGTTRCTRRSARLLAAGEIGEIGSVHFEWLLDVRHGADYFRRWHRDQGQLRRPAGAQVRHHFDLVNWWLDAAPETVFAQRPAVLLRRRPGADTATPATTTGRTAAPAAEDDPFAVRLADDPQLRALYLDAERPDGYVRDHNVFAPGRRPSRTTWPSWSATRQRRHDDLPPDRLRAVGGLPAHGQRQSRSAGARGGRERPCHPGGASEVRAP